MTRTLMTLAAVLGLVAAAPAAAAAQTPAGSGSQDSPLFAPPGQAPLFQPAARPARATSTWYGWQIIAVDLASMATSRYGGGLGIFIGSPIVHAANGQGNAGIKALAMRTGFPLLGFIAGIAIADGGDCDDRYDDTCGVDVLVAGLLGATAGLLTAMIVDVAYLANKEVPDERERPRFALFERYTPTVKLVDKGAAVGVRGTF